MAVVKLNDRVLDGDKRKAIRLQAELVRKGGFFLAGGTGLGLHLGHRLSDDLDSFTPARFDPKALIAGLTALSTSPTELRQDGAHTVRAYYDKLETSFIAYEQVPAHPQRAIVAGTEIPLADLDILAAMKAAALHDRGARRDFIDVHAIVSSAGWTVGRFIDHAARHFPLQKRQIALSLTYFVDAEKEPMPRGCAVSWDRVKSDLLKGVREWERSRDRGMER